MGRHLGLHGIIDFIKTEWMLLMFNGDFFTFLKPKNELEKIVSENSDVRRQDMKKYYRINGAIYINKASELNPQTSLNDNQMGYVLTKEHGIDVDEPQDLVVAEYYLSQACDGEFLSFIVY